MKKVTDGNFHLPNEILEFLTNLNSNNNKEWFTENKPFYEEKVKKPVHQLIGIMAERFLSLGIPLVSDPKISTFRINRDIRFSPNKEPYKTHIGFFFPLAFEQIVKRNINAPCFYFHIEPGSVFACGGLHLPPSETLKYVREKIDTEYKELETILSNKALKKEYPVILEDEKLKRVPAGYSPDHPREEWLRLKEYIILCNMDYDTVFSEELPDILTKKAAAIIPFLEFLSK